MPSVTVVIPVFNTEKYIEKCVKSVCGQTLKDLEIIIVDDGSTDSSGRIADELARDDSRIKVIHQENAGLGPARNAGINDATGDYLGFVDSDDWVEPQMFERLWIEATRINSDVCAGGIKILTSGHVQSVHIQHLAGKTLLGAEEINSYRLNYYGPKDDSNAAQPLVASTIRLYKRSLLNEQRLRFKNIRSEDVDFNIRVMKESHRINFIDTAMYCYRKDGQPSITNGAGCKMLKQFEHLIAALGDCLDNEDADIRPECYRRLQRGVFGYMRTLVNVCALSGASIVELTDFTRLVLNSMVFSQYLTDYPALNMSFAQRVLLHCMVRRNAGMTALLFRLRNRANL